MAKDNKLINLGRLSTFLDQLKIGKTDISKVGTDITTAISNLDKNKKNVIEKTLAEYEALPEDVKNNGDVYAITDDSMDGSQFYYTKDEINTLMSGKQPSLTPDIELELKRLTASTEVEIIKDGGVHKLSEKADKTSIPTNVSAFTNDAGYLTEHQDISGKANKSETLYSKVESTVIDADSLKTTGVYNCSNTPTNVPTANHGTLYVDFDCGTPYQIWIPDALNDVYKRNFVSGSWWGWAKINGGGSDVTYGFKERDISGGLLPQKGTSYGETPVLSQYAQQRTGYSYIKIGNYVTLKLLTPRLYAYGCSADSCYMYTLPFTFKSAIITTSVDNTKNSFKKNVLANYSCVLNGEIGYTQTNISRLRLSPVADNGYQTYGYYGLSNTDKWQEITIMGEVE